MSTNFVHLDDPERLAYLGDALLPTPIYSAESEPAYRPWNLIITDSPNPQNPGHEMTHEDYWNSFRTFEWTSRTRPLKRLDPNLGFTKEYVCLTLPLTFTDFFSSFMVATFIIHAQLTIRMITNRMDNYHKHAVGLNVLRPFYICQMDEDQWNNWKATLGGRSEFDVEKSYRRSIPYNGLKLSVVHEKVGWSSSEQIPGLVAATDRYWICKKVINPETFLLYRHKIQRLYFLRNSWSGLVRVVFSYSSKVFNRDTRKWQSGMLS